MEDQGMPPTNVDDIVASVEDAVRRAYALGRSDAMKRVVELAQSDDPGLRAVALLGPAEPARPDQAQSLHHAAPEPAAEEVGPHEAAAEAADAVHEARQAAPPVQAPPAPKKPRRDEPKTVGSFLADYFYPIGSKKD